MSQRDRLLQVVDDDLQQDCRDYRGLHGLMEALYGHLLARDSARIEAVNGEIVALVEQLDGRARRRAKVLGAFRLEPSAEAMQRLLGAYPTAQRPRLEQAWQQLGRLAAQCRQLNERNGKLLAMHHEILGQLIGRPQGAQLYGPQAY